MTQAPGRAEIDSARPSGASGDAPPGAEPSATRRVRVLVVGAGFGGLEVARELGRAGIETLLVDRRNHHLFQPLLYQVATAALAAPDIAEPVRKILRRQRSVEVRLDAVVGLDWRARTARLAGGATVGYDVLVLAAGAETGYFGHDDWSAHAPGLKSIEDAQRIRSRLLAAFEAAERADDPAERDRLMTVAVIGGGPTGVEMSGSIAELARFTLARDFRRIRPEAAQVLLIEAGPRLLPGFDASLADYARARLERLGVRIRLDAPVEEIEADALVVAGARSPVGLVIWAAGVRASPLAAMLGVETDRAGRVTVEPTLAVPGRPGVFALGDLANFPGPDGKSLPGLAQVAQQQGRFLGRALAAHLRDGAPLPPFRYRSRGSTAIVGRHAAVYETARFRMKGWPAWALWAVVHVYLLVGFPQRVLVSLQWLWRYLTFERGARLIDEGDLAPPARRAAAGGACS